MPVPQFEFRAPSALVENGLAAIRAELEVPEGFPADVRAEAERAAREGKDPHRSQREDRRSLPLVTIDPPKSMDLDQAFGAERLRTGYRVWYAIADIAAFITPAGAIAREALVRGVTLYCPDTRASLHPEILSEGAASLLPNDDRPAVLWRIDLDAEGRTVEAELTRATVRSREKLSYEDAQARIEGNADRPELELLREIGELRMRIEADRGGFSINLATQAVVPTTDGYRLEFDRTLPVERWNAQISLMAGMAAAALMVDARRGILRTLPAPDQQVVTALRRAARLLDVGWPEGSSYGEVVRELAPGQARVTAFLALAVRALRGAGYLVLDGEVPSHHGHAAIAAPYAHVTAPLRRVSDRYANEIVLGLCAGRAPPEWADAGLDELPPVMARARSRERALDRAVLDLTEALVLQDRVGESFEAVVTTVDPGHGVGLQLRDPAVVAQLADDESAEPGEQIQVRLTHADPHTRQVRFERAEVRQ